MATNQDNTSKPGNGAQNKGFAHSPIVAILFIVAMSIALSIGFYLGTSYQNEQPTIVQITTVAGDDIFDVQTYTLSNKNSVGLSTKSRVVKENNISSYLIEVKTPAQKCV